MSDEKEKNTKKKKGARITFKKCCKCGKRMRSNETGTQFMEQIEFCDECNAKYWKDPKACQNQNQRTNRK